MRSGSNVQLAALQNRDLELHTVLYSTVQYSTVQPHHLVIMDQWNGQQRAVTIKMIYMFGFFKSSRFVGSPSMTLSSKWPHVSAHYRTIIKPVWFAWAKYISVCAGYGIPISKLNGTPWRAHTQNWLRVSSQTVCRLISLHLIIAIKKVTSNVQTVPRQSPYIY
jgi:hypothetical protein